MPIRPENRSRYPDDWKAISEQVREEAGQRCEWCGVQNGATILRGSDDQDGVSLPAYRYADAPVYDHTFHAQTGEPIPGANWDTFDPNARGPVKVILTVAHLDHQPENCARDNLRALCQACHNAYDAPMRARGIAERKRAAYAVGDLFTESNSPHCSKGDTHEQRRSGHRGRNQREGPDRKAHHARGGEASPRTGRNAGPRRLPADLIPEPPEAP